MKGQDKRGAVRHKTTTNIFFGRCMEDKKNPADVPTETQKKGAQ